MKILIVDDDLIVCKILATQLTALGAGEVSCHAWARDALARIAGGEGIGLIFLDLRMPELDGIEFVRELAHFGYRGGLVLISGEDPRILRTAERLAQAHRLRVLGALSKPILPERLRGVLDRHARCEPAAPAAERVFYPEQLRRAIAAGELVNHYQPTVSFATGAVIGVESLVRWQHPSEGLVPPDAFVPLAEECGVIEELTQGVLRTALRDARRWHDAGYALQVAVNVSMENLAALDFPDMVGDELAASGVAPQRLALEITESRLTQDSVAALEIVTRLRLKRIMLSIDDFGTGHSSLAQLRDIPFNELKIDRGFVSEVCEDRTSRAIVDANLHLARGLGLRSVAEGVDSRAVWDVLQARGCDLAQGWFVAPAMPACDLPDWIAEWELRRPGLVAAVQTPGWKPPGQRAGVCSASVLTDTSVATR
ncbi:EAL domain-containing protein [Aromatoleum toluvorans]|uniref:EAL domain-containing protein n=1 Tax=Aromatoleum toluvorans TaxID=92002 RepID=A0ABX1Q7I9_9RHOO|nr:EAL domain-containing response regulator [Aromatoleum toluvorans]NMG46445.1 EAL domain-containing protein [Aromatoleum toluvorans]